MKYYRRHPSDYARDTAHLSLAEHGAYTVLLATQYATETALSESLDSLYRICRATSAAEQRAVRSVAETYFPVGDDGTRWNARAAAEIKRRASKGRPAEQAS